MSKPKPNYKEMLKHPTKQISSRIDILLKQSPHTCLKAQKSNYPLFKKVKSISDIHEHLTTLYMLTVQMNLKTIVELGTATGNSTVALLLGAKETKGKVFSFDVFSDDKAKEAVQEYGLGNLWKFTLADDLKVKWDKPIDHLFIDTTHTYEQTLNELEKYEPFVRNGGIITMHDAVSCPEVSKAVYFYFDNRKDIKIYEYYNNNGLFVIFKGQKPKR